MDRKKIICYMELSATAAVFTILYLMTRNFRLFEPLFLDEGKTKDIFVERFIFGSGGGQDLGFLAYCGYNVQNMAVYLLGRLAGSAATGLNIYHIMTFFAIAFASYALFRRLGISHGVSVFGSVLLMLLPYHTDRGEAQIVTSSFFMVPAVIAMLYDIYFEEEDAGNFRKYVPMVLALPWIDLNLAFMTLILMFALGLHRHSKKAAVRTAVCGLPCLAESLALYAVSHVDDGSGIVELVDRAKEEGMRLLDFVMPVRRHIYDRFFNWRVEYDVTFSASGESGLNTMGFLLAIFFLAGFVVLFFGSKRGGAAGWLSFVNMIVIVVAVIGGLGILVDYAGVHVVFWNRMGIFVIVNSAVIMGIYADRIRLCLIGRFKENRACRAAVAAVYLAVAAAAIVDVALRHAPV